ncbi:hypothetical protein [Halobacillus halophilus]|uniref:hypothetical protein n=1 Tax=Halobacillus halophilus TaxID=1570 RepID=UPI001CD276A2|nr:hypothetical protein [Halobacillus halophilus]MCA1011344.1 hypothetical protein [Halobacillus halophilus]
MKVWKIIACCLVILLLGSFHLFGLMRLYPLYITSPLLFISIYLCISFIYHRKTFKGFH